MTRDTASETDVATWQACLISLPMQVIDTYDMNNNKAVDLVEPGFQKAFGKVPHERQMVKVHMVFKVMKLDRSETN